jgi:hypothetical protein
VTNQLKKILLKIISPLQTPIKLSQSKKTLSNDEKVYSQSASSIRQSIIIILNWLIEFSGVQIASKVRSTKGLIVHISDGFPPLCLTTYSNYN